MPEGTCAIDIILMRYTPGIRVKDIKICSTPLPSVAVVVLVNATLGNPIVLNAVSKTVNSEFKLSISSCIPVISPDSADVVTNCKNSFGLNIGVSFFGLAY